MITKFAKVACALVAFGVAASAAARADILDAEDWSNHIEEINQINNTQQFRRTMNRGFDMMVGMGADGGGQSAADRIAQQTATWRATLVVPPAPPGSELQRFLAGVDPAGRREVENYMRREFAAYPAAAAQASFDPANVLDARLFALQTAFRAVRPNEPTPLDATYLLHLALSQQMTMAFTTHKITTRTKQDARDYYIIARAILLPAVAGTPEGGLADEASRKALAEKARAFFLRDAGVDPMTVTWQQLPCIGVSQVDCAAHLAMARSAMAGSQ